MKKAPIKTKTIKKLFMVGMTSYLIVAGLVKYVNTNDSSYLIVPVIFGALVIWEIYYNYFKD